MKYHFPAGFCEWESYFCDYVPQNEMKNAFCLPEEFRHMTTDTYGIWQSNKIKIEDSWNYHTIIMKKDEANTYSDKVMGNGYFYECTPRLDTKSLTWQKLLCYNIYQWGTNIPPNAQDLLRAEMLKKQMIRVLYHSHQQVQLREALMTGKNVMIDGYYIYITHSLLRNISTGSTNDVKHQHFHTSHS